MHPIYLATVYELTNYQHDSLAMPSSMHALKQGGDAHDMVQTLDKYYRVKHFTGKGHPTSEEQAHIMEVEVTLA